MPFTNVADSLPSVVMSSGRRAEMMVFSVVLEPFLLVGLVSSNSRRSWRVGFPVG